MNAETPGQALWESLRATAQQEFGGDTRVFETWDEIPAVRRERLEAAGQAAIAAQQPQAAPSPAGCECGHAQTGHAFSDDVCAVPECPCPGYRSGTAAPAGQPDAELAQARQGLGDLADVLDAVTAERDQLRAQLEQVRSSCANPATIVGRTSGTGVVNGEYLARHLLRIVDRLDTGPGPMHLMTIEMGPWCGAAGPGNGRASSQWRDVTCPACTAKGITWLRSLAWEMLATMGRSREALEFALRAGRLGVTDDQGRPLAMACADDDFAADPHSAYDKGENGGAMTDSDFYERIAQGDREELDDDTDNTIPDTERGDL